MASFAPPLLNSRDLATLVYTSGTTGQPKVCEEGGMLVPHVVSSLETWGRFGMLAPHIACSVDMSVGGYWHRMSRLVGLEMFLSV
jgi:acyl-coenzyme A synthetase/AMP-(fatty) acid ligase